MKKLKCGFSRSIVLAIFLSGCATAKYRVPASEDLKNEDSSRSETSASAPVCAGIGTRSEGWLSGGKLLKYDSCAAKIVRCETNSPSGEGWYVYSRTAQGGLISYANCQAPAESPKCVGANTRSEGWMLPGKGIKYSKCTMQVAQCGARGTRSEGWYAFELRPEGFLESAQCH